MPECLSRIGEVAGPYLEQPGFPSTGYLSSGIAFQYGACLSGWIYLGKLVYIDIIGLGGFNACCEQAVLAHPAASTGEVEAFDCEGVPKIASGVSGMTSTISGCACSIPTGILNETTTWGKIKDLYSE